MAMSLPRSQASRLPICRHDTWLGKIVDDAEEPSSDTDADVSSVKNE